MLGQDGCPLTTAGPGSARTPLVLLCPPIPQRVATIEARSLADDDRRCHVAGVTNTDSDRYGHWADVIWAGAGGVMPQLDRDVGAMEFLVGRGAAL